ncbi:DinB family protein [Deinococcus cellulosilyticus]|uniref:Damage-inducible protein DinB n=1 Tax=Deinococcus cellulosilyticus (strain DSM 18568 / NBRC 106333 / KACC 11606 / 5516J-15) TaxID=1223518 RepID=A0A511N388_DEIC1|nr:DinB family protein [Deinococcus cellulosilyticus]GEM47329.1 hypothetical protein DC3_29640 [Deinococcus cellulosilyticus NBRC 106333 = KACC 11606]
MTIATETRTQPLSELLFSDLDQEFATTRKFLELIPMEQADFKPHEKSFSLLHLANHLAGFPTWGLETLKLDVIDFQEQGEPPKPLTTREELLELFDRSLAEFKETLKQSSDEHLNFVWTMKSGDQVFLHHPRWQVLRTGIISHMVHHRAQLGVYLRLLGVPVPQSYGPTADHP